MTYTSKELADISGRHLAEISVFKNGFKSRDIKPLYVEGEDWFRNDKGRIRYTESALTKAVLRRKRGVKLGQKTGPKKRRKKRILTIDERINKVLGGHYRHLFKKGLPYKKKGL